MSTFAPAAASRPTARSRKPARPHNLAAVNPPARRRRFGLEGAPNQNDRHDFHGTEVREPDNESDERREPQEMSISS